MSEQHNKSKAARIREAQELQLQVLLRQHEELGERIIALVHKTNAEAASLVQAMRQKKEGQLLQFPAQGAQTHQPDWGRNILSRIMRKEHS